MVRKLATLGLLNYEPYMGVTLSAAGERRALDILRRHDVVERYMVTVMGLSPALAHRTAEQWEHILSEEVEQRMTDLCRTTSGATRAGDSAVSPQTPHTAQLG
jgi:DtxR family Mn-dependent transcriptional regulator